MSQASRCVITLTCCVHAAEPARELAWLRMDEPPYGSTAERKRKILTVQRLLARRRIDSWSPRLVWIFGFLDRHNNEERALPPLKKKTSRGAVRGGYLDDPPFEDPLNEHFSHSSGVTLYNSEIRIFMTDVEVKERFEVSMACDLFFFFVSSLGRGWLWTNVV